MTYLNDGSFYSTSFTFGELDAHPILNLTSATEVNIETSDTFTNSWSVGRQPGYMVGEPTSLGAEASFDPTPSAGSYGVQTTGHDYLSYPEHWHAQSYRPGIVSRDDSFASTVTSSETPTVIPSPSRIPFDCWGANESGPSTTTFYANAQTLHQPSTGSTRTGMVSSWRLRPYGTSRARSNENKNAEAGPPNLAPPLIPCAAPPASHPSGGLSEATADVDTNQKITEEVASSIRRPRGMGKSRDWRIRYQEDIRRLCIWAQERRDLEKRPSHGKALGIALEVIETIRVPMYTGPRLIKGIGKRTAQGKKGPDAEHKRRKGTRELNEELSQYYQLAANQEVWGCPELLSKVLDDLEGLPARV